MTDRATAHHIANLGNKDPDIRRSAANALGELGDPVAVPALIGRLNDKAEFVRRKAMIALKRIGTPASPELARALRSREAVVRTAVVEVLTECGDASAIPNLIEALKDENIYVRDAAVILLGKIGDLSAVPALIGVLRDRYDALWREKYEAAAKDEVTAAMVAALPEYCPGILLPADRRPSWQDSHNLIRCNSARLLGQLGDLSALPALIEALQDEDIKVRQYAAEALGLLGDLSAVPALVQAWGQGERYQHRPLFGALWRLGDAVALPRKILADARFSVQQRIDLLERLRSIRYSGNDFAYEFSETSVFCQQVLAEEDAELRRGAQAVLNWLSGERHLLHASAVDPSRQSQDLVRPSQGSDAAVAPKTLLRSSDMALAPAVNLPQTPQTFWQRLFRKS